MAPPKKTSDTVIITSDGRAFIDVEKLLAKEHMQKTIRAMREKTTFVSGRPVPSKPHQVRLNIDRA